MVEKDDKESLFPFDPGIISNSRVIREISEILILVKRKQGVRGVYLKFEGFRSG
jgi:hypothetical protein